MMRSQRDVDKHVQEIFRNIRNEKEKNLRCYNVAKLYLKVGDNQRAKQYVELYLKERPDVAGAHKLLGQALEGLKQNSKALEEYKCSLSYEERQPDLVLKVCELLVETKSAISTGEATYWVKRAEEFADNHPSVFRLKEYVIKMEDGSGDQTKLMQLVEKEIEARPQDPLPRVRLLHLYLEGKRVLDAYKYCIDLEARSLFNNDLQWYTCVVDVFKAYHQDFRNLDWEFYLNQLSVLERFTALCSQEKHTPTSTSFSSAVLLLDQALFEASQFCLKGGEHLLQECIKHMSGQLCFYLGAALLRCENQKNSNLKERAPLVWALMALAYASPEALELPSHFASGDKEKCRKQFKAWKKDRSFRCSQAGHILLSMPNGRKLFSQLSSGSWRGKSYKMMFFLQSVGKHDVEKSSFFMNDDRFINIPESTPSSEDLVYHDDLALSHRPDSLHALVWLGLQYVERAVKHVSLVGTSYALPHRLKLSFGCHIFEELKLSTNNLVTNGVETLSRLDIHTFLYASVFCAAAAQDSLYSNSRVIEGRPVVLPIDLTESLCNEAQLKWWSSVCRLHSSKSRSDIGEVRMIVSRGLEVVRLLGNHGMNIRLVVLLAKLFTDKAHSASTPKDNVQDYKQRALMFWKSAIFLLERLQRDMHPRMPENPLFSYKAKDLNNAEVEMLLEEGKLFVACQLIEEESYEEAIKCIQNLKNPYASFYEGSIYKKLADQLDMKVKKSKDLAYAARENLSEEDIAEMKSKRVIFLRKSRAALNLTLDRVRSPQFAGCHSLDLELAQHIEEVEKCLEESDGVLSAGYMNTFESQLDDSIFSNKCDDSLHNVSQIVNTSIHHTVMSSLHQSNGLSPYHEVTSTPFKNRRNLNASTLVNESPSIRSEARPSPERLDAQMRRMTLTTDAVMQTLVEQNKQITDTMKTMRDTLDKTRDAVEELQKQMLDLRYDVGRLKISDSHPPTGTLTDYHPGDEAASQLHSIQAYPSSASYYPSQPFNYDTRNPASTLPMQPILPQALFPQAQVPMVQDPRVFLPPYYPQAGLGLANTMPGTIPNHAPGSVPTNMPSQVDSGNAADLFRKIPPLMSTPIVMHPTLSSPAIDLSTSAGMSNVPILQHLRVTSSDVISVQNSSVPSQAKISMGTPGSGEMVPHNFQISMPAQVTIPTTESLEKSLPPVKPISADSVLPNVPMPAYSAVSSKQSDSRPNRLSTGSASGNDTFTEDADYNPCADFKPIIPLPEEIVVTTGEEDETPLFVCRAKLFRFVGGEWKERGTGDMKILKNNSSGKPRILMRREFVHKICANHLILPEMELAPQTGSDRAWSWGAHDYADSEPQFEKLCVRFKTVEDAKQFKNAFDEGRKLAKLASISKVATSTIEGQKPAKDTSDKVSTPSKVELGGFSFTSPPVLKPVENQVKTTPSKDKDNASSVAKPSPFANFSFNPSSSNIFAKVAQTSAPTFTSQSSTSILSKPVLEVASSQATSTTLSSPSLMFGQKPLVAPISSSGTLSSGTQKEAPIFFNSNQLDFAALAAQNKTTSDMKNTSSKGFEGAGSQVFGAKTVATNSPVNVSNTNEQESGDTEDFEPTAVFNPVIPLPSLVEVRTGEEDEEIIFEERSKLHRFDPSEKQWKERGTGKMKVLKNPKTGKVRLLMRREQVLKVCCNHLITPDLQFKPLNTSDRALTWSAQDYSEEEVKVETFSLLFKTSDLMKKFMNVVKQIQAELANSPKKGNQTTTVPPPVVKPLSELFKPKQGSWECSGCFTRNDATMSKCPCCSQPKPGSEIQVSESKAVPESKFSFGIPAVSDVSQSQTALSSLSTPKGKEPSLAEMFKPKEGSWTCQACYTRADPNQTQCLACETPKPGHENEKKAVKSNFSFGSSNTASATFSFGSNIKSEDQKVETKSFSFGSSSQQGESKPTFSFGVPSSASVDTNKGFSFGSNSTQNENPAGTSFVFGTSTIAPIEQPSFGSPHKFEFQMRPASPSKSPAKSPGAPSGGEESEEEFEEETGDLCDFKPVIPLPDKVPVLTGEEDETILYCHRAKLFRFVDGEWKERGLGDIKVLCHKITNKARLLMRREQVLKICLNHYISTDLEIIPKDEKTWMWAAQDFSDGVVAAEKFACRFKTPEIALEFKAAVDKAKAECSISSPIMKTGELNSSSSAPTSYGTADKEPTTTMSNFTFKLGATAKPGVSRSLFGSNDSSSLNSDDLQVVYEAKVTPEEKSAALKLQLPENFYLYKQAPPCTGCIGCEKDSDSDQSDHHVSSGTAKTKVSTTTPFNASAAVFGSGSSLFSSSSFSAPSSTHIFGGSSMVASPTTGSGGLFSGGTLNSGLGSTAVNSHSTAFPILGSKFSAPVMKENNSKEEKSGETNNSLFLPVSESPSFASLAAATPKAKESSEAGGPSFLPVNDSISFASLAAAAPGNHAFTLNKDSSKSFNFAGAGSKVFGVSSSEPSLSEQSKTKDKDSDGENDPAEVSGEQDTHDPHFEPIIAMPDVIEVRTGEEEEERVFCQRAKLYRYVVETKEWKERGVGEMKILKDPVKGTFRLLLRREQVHKVVLNQRLDTTVKLKPLNTSDSAWCWGGMNYAENPEGALEELAIRFKNSQLATEFRTSFEECQQKLREGGYGETTLDGGQGVVIKEVNDNVDEEEEEDDEDYEDEDEENGAYTDGEYCVLFEKPGSFAAEVEGSDESIVSGRGDVRVLTHAQTAFVEMDDESGSVLCRAPILGDAEVKREGNICIWRCADDEGLEKKFVTTFESEADADDFQECYTRISLEIVERTYDYVDERQDSGEE